MKNKHLITGLMFLLLLSACTSQQTAQEPLAIGLLTPLTGKVSTLGETVQRAATMAVEEINAAGGVNGRSLKLIVEDSKGESASAVSAAQKLVEVDRVPVILEAATSGEAAAIAPIAQKAGVLHYSILATTDSLVDAGDYVFKMRESAIPHAKAVINAMRQEGISQVAVLHLSDEYCTNMVAQFKAQAKNEGITILTFEPYRSDDVDVRSQIAKIKSMPAQGIYVCGFYQELGLVFKQMYELNVSKRLFSVTTFEHPLVKKNAGAEAIEGTIYSVSPLDCTKALGFCEKYEARFGQKPDYRAAFVYDAVHIVASSLGQNADPAKLKEVLLKVDHRGATGSTYFDEKGNAIKEVVLHQVKNGEWTNYP